MDPIASAEQNETDTVAYGTHRILEFPPAKYPLHPIQIRKFRISFAPQEAGALWILADILVVGVVGVF